MTKKQKGFSIVEVLILLLVVAIVFTAGFYVWNRINKSEEMQSQNTTESIPGETEAEQIDEQKKEVKWLTYVNEEAGLTFNYPEDWKEETAEPYFYEDGMFGAAGGSVKSPDGNELVWNFLIIGGGGGGCTPNPEDTPFAQGNECNSKQILNVEKVQSVKEPKGKEFRNMYEDALFITHTKYQSTRDKEPTYHICLDPYYTSETDYHQNETPKVGTRMGLLFPCDFWRTGFNVRFDVKNEADFDSPDAIIAEQIMKTFDSI